MEMNSFMQALRDFLPEHIIIYLGRGETNFGYTLTMYNWDTKQTVEKNVDFIAGNEYDLLRECVELYRNTWDTPLHRAMK